MAKDAYWFRHDSNAHRDPKMMMLRTIHGYEGIGIFWSIVEILRDQEGYCFRIDGKFGYRTLAGLLGYDTESLEEMIRDMVYEFELFYIEKGCLFSPSLTRRMERWETLRNNGKKGGRPRGSGAKKEGRNGDKKAMGNGQNSGQEKPKENQKKTKAETNKKTNSETIRGEDRREEDSIEDNRGGYARARERKPFLGSSVKSSSEIQAILKSQQIFLDEIKMKFPGVDVDAEIETFSDRLVFRGESAVGLDQIKAGFRGFIKTPFAKPKTISKKRNQKKQEFDKL